MSDWHYSHLTAADNPAIPPEAFAALVAEYPAGSPQLEQEVYAKLLEAGAGLAFPEWDSRAHVVVSVPDPDTRVWTAGLDWGYDSPGCFVLLSVGGDKDIQARWDHPFQSRTPFDVGETVGHALKRDVFRFPEWVWADSAMWAVNDGGPTIAEQFQAGLDAALGERSPKLVPAPKGPGSRAARKMLLHQGLAFDVTHLKPEGDTGRWVLAPYHAPRLRFHRDAGYCVKSIPRLPKDERNPEDVDTQADDHAYDALTYALMGRTVAPTDVPDTWRQGQHPGFHADGTRRNPKKPQWDERYARMLGDQRDSEERVGPKLGWSYRFSDEG